MTHNELMQQRLLETVAEYEDKSIDDIRQEIDDLLYNMHGDASERMTYVSKAQELLDVITHRLWVEFDEEQKVD